MSKKYPSVCSEGCCKASEKAAITMTSHGMLYHPKQARRAFWHSVKIKAQQASFELVIYLIVDMVCLWTFENIFHYPLIPGILIGMQVIWLFIKYLFIKND